MAGMAIEPTAENPVKNLPASIHLHKHQYEQQHCQDSFHDGFLKVGGTTGKQSVILSKNLSLESRTAHPLAILLP